MKEQQCLNCGNFNLLSRHTCEYCGSPDLKIVTTGLDAALDKFGRAIAKQMDAELVKLTEVDMTVDQFVDQFGSLGPAFMQCGKITGYIPNGVTLCGKPMMHEGEC